jgi:hypothetical protein
MRCIYLVGFDWPLTVMHHQPKAAAASSSLTSLGGRTVRVL